jgi:hypothetical protein
MLFLRSTLLGLFLLLAGFSFSQRKITGVVTDEQNIPIPFVQVFVKNSPELRTETDQNGLYTLQLYEGEYFLVFRIGGYEDREAYVTIQNSDVTKDIQLFEGGKNNLDEVTISSKRVNVGRNIIMKVVDKRDHHGSLYKSYRRN